MAIDLRSDTVTHPTPEMRKAMYEAEVGDDVYGEDPTVNRLQELAAEMLGKEAALLVVSGTMGNLVGVLSHAGRGQEAIVGDEAHIYHYEVGGISALGGVVFHPIPNGPRGELNPDDVARAIRPPNVHFAQAGVVCLENTHNRCGGAALRPEQLDAVADVAHARGVPVHLDGARIFNAAVALGVPAARLAAKMDSVTFCLSKGLAAPVGSVLVGSRDYIDRARRIRKSVGGGMRQAGVIAAAGIVALTHMVDRLAEDHARAKRLAEGLAALEEIDLDPETVETNIVVFRLSPRAKVTPDQFLAACRKEGVLLSTFGDGRLRAVTHWMIEDEDVERALQVVARVVRGAVAV